MARDHTPPNADDVRALIAPHMDGHVAAGAFFRVAGGRRSGLLGLLLWGPRQLALERQAGLATFTYLAINGVDVGAFELRWNPMRIHRVLGHWHRDSLDARRVDPDGLELRLDDRVVQLIAAVPGPDADAVIDRLTRDDPFW